MKRLPPRGCVQCGGRLDRRSPRSGTYDLSDDTTISLHSDGAMTLEVAVDDDLAAVALTALEVRRLRAVLNGKDERHVR